MFEKYILPILVLVGVILFSSCIGPMLSSVDGFQDTKPHICPVCKSDGTCTCYKLGSSDPFTKKLDPETETATEETTGTTTGTATDSTKGTTTGTTTDSTKGTTTATATDSTKGTATGTATGITKGTTTSTITSTPGTIEPALQGKHPIPYFELVDRVRKNEEIEEKQSKHIEDIRKVLANTITTLREDDVLPSGSHCSCANAPVVDPLTGEVDLTEGCRPPGWLRMMNSRNQSDEECK
jgi:hypothetical protein